MTSNTNAANGTIQKSSILVANVGNRNLSLDTIDLSEFFGKDKLGNPRIYPNHNFRSFTEMICKDLHEKGKASEFFGRLGLNILDEVLNYEGRVYEKVILIGSNQEGLLTKKGQPERIDQDTLFAAEIIKLLAELKDESHGVEVKILKNRVANSEELYFPYKKLLAEIKAENPNGYFVICDAGGTAQQKMAMKIMAEYLWEDNEFQVVYVSKGNGPAEFEKQGSRNLKGIIAGFQAEQLIKAGQFSAAATIIKPSKKHLYKYLLVLERAKALLLDGELRNLVTDVQKQSNSVTNLNPLLDFFNVSHPAFSNKEEQRLKVMLALVQFYHHRYQAQLPKDDYATELCVSAFLFHEAYIQYLVEKYLKINLSMDYRGQFAKITKALNDYADPAVSNMKRKYPLLDPSFQSLNVIAFFLSAFKKKLPDHLQLFIAQIEEIYDPKWSGASITYTDWWSLRNNYAHHSQGVTHKDLVAAMPNLLPTYLPTWYGLLGLPADPTQNQFDLVGNLIIAEL